MSFTRFNNNKQNQNFSRFIAPPSIEDDPLLRQIDNAKIRVEDAGYQMADTDKRNWFEKATNLPQKQNFFFDALELLGRPSNALKNVLDKTVHNKSQNVGEALYRGISGRDKVSGTQLADNLGIENKVGRFALGTALDIALDPITFVPGGVIAKGVKGTAGVATKPIKAGYEALESASPALKSFRETRVEPAAESVKDALGYMFNPQYKKTETLSGGQSDFLKQLERETENTRRFMQEESLKDVVSTAKAAGGVESGIDVGRIMEKDLKHFEDALAYRLPDGTITENKSDVLGTLSKTRETLKETGKGLSSTKKEYQGAIGEFADAVRKTDAEISKLYMQIERNIGKQLDKETKANLRDASKNLRNIESQLNNFDASERSLQRYFEKQVRDEHETKFDLIKRVRQSSPNGIKGIASSELPTSLRNHVREAGKGIDEIAGELGYTYADDLIQDLKAMQNIPRRLDRASVESLARKEMERTGALRDLELTKKELEVARNEISNSIKQVKSTAPQVTDKSFGELVNNPRYTELKAQRDTLKNQLDTLIGDSKQARQSNLDEIKRLEQEMSNLRNAAQNPITIQKEIPRIPREYSTDSQVNQAAEKLMTSNNVIRQYAEENGIPISELEGYMTHVLSQAERELRKRTKLSMIDQGRFGIGNPNKKILNERKLQGSAEDINERLGRQMFEPNAYFATALGQRRLIDYVQAVQFRRKVLSNPDFSAKYVQGMDIPRNATVIDTNNYTFLKESGDMLEGIGMADQVGGKYVVTKAAKQALDRFQKINADEGTKAFMKSFNAVQNTWKKMALFSPGYHVRNLAGNMWNSYLAGMNPYDITKYMSEATGELQNVLRGKESAMFTEFRKQGLMQSGLTKVEFGYSQEPGKAIEKAVRDMSKSGLSQVGQRLNPKNMFTTSREIGEGVDVINRYSLYKWARDKGVSPEKAAEKVKETLFDYLELTPFEQNVMRSLFPFYTWSRKNIPFQIKKVMEDPRKFQRLNQVRLNAQEGVGLDEETMPDYMKENFYMPLYGSGGKGKMLGLNLPVGDIAKLNDPLKLGVDLTTPLIKTPIELATNFNMFRRKPIQEFEGQQKVMQLPFTDTEFGIPVKTAYSLEQATGQVGRGMSAFLQRPDNVDQDNKFRAPSMGISSFVKDFDAERFNYLQRLQKLRELQDLIRYIEQQEGEKPRTVAEIRRSR